MKLSNIEILGTTVPLTSLGKNEMKGLAIGIIVEFHLYRGTFHSNEYIFYQSKTGKEYTPSVYSYYTEKISAALNKPAVLLTGRRDFNNRIRLYEQGVFFVAGSRYVYLPDLVVNTLSHTPRRKRSKFLSPKAQFLLLYWLQEKTLGADVTIGTFTEKWNFSYISISRSLTELEQYGLCDSKKHKDNSKTYHFCKDKKSIWEDSQEILRSPISRIVWSDNAIPEGFPITGINALSHYSLLNPENVNAVAVLDSTFRESTWKELTNEIEGKYRIEIWRYEPDMFKGEGYVDRLSLVLSMLDNPDARIEGEVERIIQEMQW